MRGEKVIVRAFENESLARLVWDVVPDGVLITTRNNFIFLNKNKKISTRWASPSTTCSSLTKQPGKYHEVERTRRLEAASALYQRSGQNSCQLTIPGPLQVAASATGYIN